VTAVAPDRDLSALFDPASVAVLGASNDESKYGNWISVQALRMAGVRPVHLINHRAEPVLGQPTYRSLAEAPGPAELVVIAVPAAGFEPAVDDALRAGARAIVGITAGFAELGAEGGRCRTGWRGGSARPARCCSGRTAWAWRTPRPG